MKKTINKSHVEGFIYENELVLNKAGASAKNPGMEYVSGKINVQIADNVVIPVDIYESAITSKGTQNGKFGTAKSLVGAPSVLKDGIENAVRIRIDSAISLNEWYKGEELVSTPRNFGGFIHVITADPNPAATFETDMLIVNSMKETKKDPKDGSLSDTGRLVLNGYIFDYAGKILPVRYIVANENGVKYFQSLAPNTFTKVWGNQISSTIKTTKIEPNAFGEDMVVESEYTRREWIVTGAIKEPYNTVTDITLDEVKTALATRNIDLATMKERAEQRAKNKASGNKPAGAAPQIFSSGISGDTGFKF